ncbi:MAG: hypothetical protein IT370_33640 [Deltaproteobacteria bacterium]|nr:hypothetical protein [Deltaproteobacteria bacterium]
MKRCSRFALLMMAVALGLPALGCGDDDDGPVDSGGGDPIDSGRRDGALDATVVTDAAATVDAAAPDASVAPGIVINELYMTTLGGDGRRYVELRAAAGTPLTGLQLRLLRSNGTVAHTIDVAPGGTLTPGDGLWVVGGALVSNVDQFYSNASWGLDSSQGAVQLIRNGVAGPILVDLVGYGPAVTPAPPTPPTATVEGATAVPVPSADTDSIGRRAGAADSNVNSADLCRMTASPGAVNTACL